VAAVAVNLAETSINVLEALRPDVYIKGGEYRDEAADVTGNITRERQAVERHGGRIHYTDDIVFSSTRLLNEHFEVFTPQQRAYLAELRQRLDPARAIERLQGLQGLRVLVVGDTIVDEYHYVTALGQSGKYHVPTVRYDSQERFAGGAVAVANHLAGFVREVTLVSALGRQESHAAFLRGRLKPGVAPQWFWFEERPTLVKRRFVAAELGKLFEVYFSGDSGPDPAVDAAAADWLRQHLGDYDLVVVPDFGNGLIGPAMVAALCQGARFLAVNTQINSGNRGYHVATRYPRADLVSLNEPELRMAAHDRHGPLDQVGAAIGEQLQARAVAITRGVNGVLCIDRGDGKVHEVPALSTRVVDRIGAGDAFLALAALTLAGTGDCELAAFTGSVAAALDVQIVCNREVVEPAALFKYLTTLLK
jgi:rfaE bifunctional protein kinase chain/domain